MSEEDVTSERYVPIGDMTSSTAPEERKVSQRLYISHFISTWNSRGFEFGAVLFLAGIYPGTLMPISIYALCRALAAILFSSSVGNYIDSSNRLKVVRTSIVGQRTSVALSCAVFLILLLFRSNIVPALQYSLFFILVLFAAVEKLCIIMNTIAVERDWVVVIAGENEALLNVMNSQMRRIDLFCKLLSPLFIAFLHGWSSKWAIGVTLFLNCSSVAIEYVLIALVYRQTLELAIVTRHSASMTGTDGPFSRTLKGVIKTHWCNLKLYTSSPAFLPSMALSILFLTVLSFAGQMITYLASIQNPRLSSIHIGIIRTLATILELSATFVAPLLISHLGAVRAGIWSLSWQCMSLTPGVLVLWHVDSAPYATAVLVTSVILSRAGLWSFDLVAQLQIQNSVEMGHRGTFSATESSMQNLFELCAFAMTIVWSKPEQFRLPATISLGAVYLAAALYARFVRLNRGHLFHLPPCCESIHAYKAVQTTEEEQELSERL